MKQIIDIFMLAADEISTLSPSTQIIFFSLALVSLFYSLMTTYKNYKELVNG